ncbi:mucolipin-3 [Caerostris darwini]|uniref:Mucolipin-3 n=1 Tax=Caerostris darwini TaxID=1538125 RepID=A0AAV4T3A7_9ARAC|nr:mucolipin-3 [Caerostris darwini]
MEMDPELRPLLVATETLKYCCVDLEQDVTSSGPLYVRREELHAKLNDYFMSTFDKWSKKRLFPFNLCFQIVFFFIVTCMLYWYGSHRSIHLKQHSEMVMALNRVFLKDWSQDYTSDPSTNQVYGVYTVPEFFENVDHVVKQYTELKSFGFGSYGYDSENGTIPPVNFCSFQYEGDLNPDQFYIGIKSSIEKRCLTIPVQNSTSDFSFVKFLRSSNYSLNFGTLRHAHLNFTLRMVLINHFSKTDGPECYRLNLKVKYDNSKYDGIISVLMKIHYTRTVCNMKSIVDDGDNLYYMLRLALNIFVIVLSFISLVMCAVSLCRGVRLLLETVPFIELFYGIDLPSYEKLDFIDFWHIMTMCGDLFIIYGCYKKIEFERNNIEIFQDLIYGYDIIALSFGYLLKTLGILKYFKSLPIYNIFTLTMKKASTSALKFLSFSVILFCGFSICGWIAFAPFNPKFDTMSSSSESLFSAMNGDDMIGTYTSINTDYNFIWWIFTIYFSFFLLIFLYVATGLLGALIADGYEVVKGVKDGTPLTTVQIFLAREDYIPIDFQAPEFLFGSCQEQESNYFKAIFIWLKNRCSSSVKVSMNCN